MSFPPPDKKDKKRFAPRPSSYPSSVAPAVAGSEPADAQVPAPVVPRRERLMVLSAAEVYARSWQAHDARYLKQLVEQYPDRKGRPLRSLTRERFPNGYWIKPTQPLYGRIRPYPGIFVCAGNKFSQDEIPGNGTGICHALSLEFMNFRRLGFGIAQIFGIFRTPDFAREFVALQERIYAFSADTIVESQSRRLQIAEQSLRQQWHFTRKTETPSQTAYVRRCMPYLRLTGSFEHDPAIPLCRHLEKKTGILPCYDRSITTIRQQARGVAVTWDASALNEPLAQPEFNSRLLIEQHIFEQMQRSCNERTVSGNQQDEALPFFLLILRRRKNIFGGSPTTHDGHAIVVEFNVVNGMLTTPRGIFDPNYGWMEPKRGFCSLDFDMAIECLFSTYADEPPYSGGPPGIILAFQYHSASNGITNDAAYVRKWGGLPWTNYRPDGKGGK